MKPISKLAILALTSFATVQSTAPVSAKPAPSRVLKLKRHAFPDVTMGTPAAYTAMLPPGWKATGRIEWKPVGEVPFPQQTFEITSPQKGRITYQPMMTFSYTQSDMMGTQGIPAPRNFPQWLAGAAGQMNPDVSNVKLVRSTRNTKAEASMAKMAAATGGAGGMQREVYVIVLDYNEGGTRRREELNVTYARFQPYMSQGLNSQMWSIAHGGSVSAPANGFDAQRVALWNVANTLRPTPQWSIQSQSVIAEMSRRRAANNWELIRARGRQISQLSDAQYAAYKKSQSAVDAAQRQRINGIYETDDFRDTTGNIVNLPMHYQHVFSDGKGNYVLSNNSGDKPGGAWKSIRPLR